MALKALKVVTNEAPAKKSSSVGIVDVSGTDVETFNRAVIAAKDAEAAVERARVAVLDVGLNKLWEECVANPSNPPSSIKLRDDSGATVVVSGQDKYSNVDEALATAMFESLGAEISDHVQYTIAAKFDSAIFLAKANTSAGEEGNFSAKIYNEYQKAIDQATAKLIAAGLLPVGTKSPLSTAQVVRVKPDFHKTRFSAFPTVEQQKALHEACPNTVTLKPVIEGEGEEKPKKVVPFRK